MHTLPAEQARQLATQRLMQHQVCQANAESVSEALVEADIDGIHSHGLSRLKAYCLQAQNGKVNGFAEVQSRTIRDGFISIDACHGFAFPALTLARQKLLENINKTGIALTAIHRSHHSGVVGHQVEKLAQHNLIAIMFSNSPKAISPWNGFNPLFGTNPIAFASARKQGTKKLQPLIIDLSLSKIARGKVMLAQQQNQPIAEGLAIDEQGKPTTDPSQALKGSMLPIGDAKGYALVLMVEILAAALTGANFGFESSSFFDDKGQPPAVGQLLLAIDPTLLASRDYYQRLELLISMIEQQPEARLPGQTRLQKRQQFNGNLNIPADLYQFLTAR